MRANSKLKTKSRVLVEPKLLACFSSLFKLVNLDYMDSTEAKPNAKLLKAFFHYIILF